jgi:hypothetical protein
MLNPFGADPIVGFWNGFISSGVPIARAAYGTSLTWVSAGVYILTVSDAPNATPNGNATGLSLNDYLVQAPYFGVSSPIQWSFPTYGPGAFAGTTLAPNQVGWTRSTASDINTPFGFVVFKCTDGVHVT